MAIRDNRTHNEPARPRGRKSGEPEMIPNPYLLYLGEPKDELSVKTSRGVAEWRPELCIGYDPFHAPAPLLIAVRSAFPRLQSLVNQPFAGAYVPLRHYNTDASVRSVMLEIRRDMYMDERAMTPDRERFDELRASLQNLVETLTEDPSLARDEASAEPSHDGDR